LFIDITNKDFGEKKGEKDWKGKSTTWQNREIDWYNAERRFIFATKNKKQRDKWINKLNVSNVKWMLADGLKKVMMASKRRETKLMLQIPGLAASNPNHSTNRDSEGDNSVDVSVTEMFSGRKTEALKE